MRHLGRRQLLRAGLLGLAGIAAGCAEREASVEAAGVPRRTAGGTATSPTRNASRGADASPAGPSPASPSPSGSPPPEPAGSTDPSPQAAASPDAGVGASEPGGEAGASPHADGGPTETAGESPPDAVGETAPPSPETTPDRTAAPAARSATVAVLCRSAWGAAAARDGGRRHGIERITIHHSAVTLGDNRKAPDRIRQHQRFHQDSRGWVDIAYHYGIDRNGHVYELRDVGLAGDTGTNYDPAGHLLLLAEGNFDEEQPTDAQLAALARVAAAGIGRFGLGGSLDEVVSGHRDHAGTSCPGAALYARLGDLRAAVRRELDAGGVDLRAWCDRDAHARVEDIRAGRA